RITKLSEECFYLPMLTLGHLHADKYPAGGGTMIAVMEHGNIPTPRYATDKVIERARTFGKLKTVNDFVSDRRVAADHIANMQFRQLVFGHVDHGVALLF